jgi:SPP1 gp7 family putative phage head morphogenesis protein
MTYKIVQGDWTIPHLAGVSNDGTEVYVDSRVPEKFHPMLAVHEITEWHLMRCGMPYLKAHRLATRVEKEAVERAGYDWATYDAEMRGYIKAAEHEKVRNVPPDLYLKPYLANDGFKTLPPIRANLSNYKRYRKAIQSLVADMAASVEHWVSAQFNDAPPVLASDASPSDEMANRLAELTKYWLEKFEEAAPKIAELYMRRCFTQADSSFQQALKKYDWTVKFQMTKGAKDALDAVINENIGLIKSIPQQYLQQVEGAVMRSFSAGRDLHTLVKDLKEIYPKASHRAELIALDQCNKATSVITRARQLEVGITEAVWMHSGAGKHPRPEHVKANGRRYFIAEGCLIDGEYIFPGEAINCRCTSKPILPI